MLRSLVGSGKCIGDRRGRGRSLGGGRQSEAHEPRRSRPDNGFRRDHDPLRALAAGRRGGARSGPPRRAERPTQRARRRQAGTPPGVGRARGVPCGPAQG